jgi:hypothetical protein
MKELSDGVEEVAREWLSSRGATLQVKEVSLEGEVEMA